MPIVQPPPTSIPAGGKLSVMADSIYETLPFPAFVEFAVHGSALGLTMSISSGTDILAEDSGVNLGTVNVYPKYPDDFYLNDTAGYLEKLKFIIKNPTAGAITAMAVVRIAPLTG